MVNQVHWRICMSSGLYVWKADETTILVAGTANQALL